LRKIQTFSSRILETEYAKLSENAKKHFSRMQMSAYRMQNLIQDLIAYSRTNAQEIKFEIVEFLKIIEDVKETLSEELEQNDVTFKIKSLCEIKIIPVQFTQVILNLVSNSIKFVKSGHPIIIEIDCEKIEGKKTGIEILDDNKHYSHISFSDNGIGFDQQYDKKIFEVFQRLHSKEDYKGTGIGLAIVKRIIENHEGIISASSAFNEGATFDIYIPAP
jgi:signal transduction histidine kinase